MSSERAAVRDLLYRLGVTENYIGFLYTSYAVLLCMEQPERLLLVTKWLYPEIAKQYRTKWTAVERDIRTVNSIIWMKNRPLLEQLARVHLEQKPRNAQLLAILAASFDGFPANCGQDGADEPESGRFEFFWNEPF
ncbi:MAG: sporulation protein [Subdoligranulum sp.]|nr:sporulation protein [Subdoligranulum sp.]